MELASICRITALGHLLENFVKTARISRKNYRTTKKAVSHYDSPLVLALPIFPGRLQPSIVGRSELNFRVRDGNGWTLALINTNYHYHSRSNNLNCTSPFPVCQQEIGDPWESRTPVCGVRGRRLDHLTNGPFGAPSGTRTQDPLIKSQLLYQLS